MNGIVIRVLLSTWPKSYLFCLQADAGDTHKLITRSIMRKKTGNAYFEKLWKEMISHFETFLKTGGQAELHKFRVSIKKLKSLLVLFESGRKRGSLLKRFKPVQKVFKKAGDIRNAQINLQLSEKFDIRDDVFAEQQRQVVSKGISEFQQNRKKFKRNLRDCHKDILSHLDPPNRSTIRTTSASARTP